MRPFHVVIGGGGFGGLTAAKTLGKEIQKRKLPCKLTLIDKENHHLFQPLLYQVATAGLAATDIAVPIRSILSRIQEVEVRMETIERIDLEKKMLFCSKGVLSYDFLILSLGMRVNYFGHEEWSSFCLGLKTLGDGRSIRNVILNAFEKAEIETNPKEREKYMTFVIVGGGPTGVELAGALAELSKKALKKDFRNIDPANTRIILLEAAPRILLSYNERLSALARSRLEKMGVEIMVSKPVEKIEKGKIFYKGGMIEASTILWAAGVCAMDLPGLDVPKVKDGRIKVLEDLTVPGHPEIFVIGDMAMVPGVPAVAPAAIQMGKYAAYEISRRVACQVGRRTGRDFLKPRAFHYFDKGMMTTLGRGKAIVQFHNFGFNGYLAWIVWLLVHIITLISFRNRLTVLIQWAWAYFRFKPGARLLSK
ncbi:NAD(P)/FAD-dependent oxidoreductase [Candidatus Methylacidiphilum fumarolicum]|uniref:NADH:ubiquinone reductase (non-electrogenic) n=2 Tax=Candidatus Methylacidiphilum fumarolicum TaxID=591154 RepID=I0JVE9_METFB|nr:NAD(P)/FAD-dependent oxidoreductase [Candidatus Methylacidiphilum fumarolicum]MBW6414879.1 NAD(P)/FAD-dependent oxidoreductase [Candidatus Methylacidiphilum fumarolicum]TFE68318.1 hypothetical protein A7K73_00860 [Candidatus Methylacidiphilum fumarolicum]TFE73543.1 NAD(P)/FAD-dependent oxidoreductase [Candidatus Methylacidiphilum fumarolicum]TFE74996.1 NAD(P)/FAD-dependent oxidoreductase [Candidatus Methylacidiphilum fumarolicum]TFE76539.1 hypothetical protein A7D33_09350 [Candidatus Methyl